MGLPSIKHTLYEHYLVGQGKNIKFRPFTNQEQKILLLAKESKGSDTEVKDIYRAIKQVLEGCTVGTVDVEKLCTFDIEDLFLRIRSKSVGEVVDIRYRYDYEQDGKKLSEFINVKVNLDEVKVQVNPEHDKKIMLSENLGIIMRYPTFTDLENITSEDDIAMACIDYIFDDNETYNPGDFSKEELEKFFGEIDIKGLLLIRKFFETMPALKHEVDVALPDGTVEKARFKGLEDFFI